MRVVFVGRKRHIWLMLLWYFLTLGIYRRVWLYRVNKEIDGHAALGTNHGANLFLLLLPFIGPTIVTYRTTRSLNDDLHAGAPIKYGPTGILWAWTFFVPLIGPSSHMAWSQDRLNRYWDYERGNVEHGIELNPGLDKDKRFVAELNQARVDSYHAGSRFDRKRAERKQRWRHRTKDLRETQEIRRQVRAAGGTTPVLPWRRPQRPPVVEMKVTCGRCDQAFQARHDPYADTPLLCPKCGLTEVIPSLRGDALKEPEPAGFTSLEVDCPKCQTHFHALRDLHDKTVISCYNCGKQETLPAPKPAKPTKAA